MKAVVWHGRRDVQVETVDDPVVREPTDAIVRITSTGICGSDLHLYEVLGPFMTEGDILGHDDRSGRRHRGRPLRRGVTPGADQRGHRRDRRCGDPAPVGRSAQVVGARSRPREVPEDGPARDRRRGPRHDRRRDPRPRPRRLPGLLRRRSLRRVDALRPPLPRGTARPRGAAAHHHDTGDDHQRTRRTASCRSRTPNSSAGDCPTATSRSSTPVTSCGRRLPGSTRRPSSRPSPLATP